MTTASDDSLSHVREGELRMVHRVVRGVDVVVRVLERTLDAAISDRLAYSRCTLTQTTIGNQPC
jgi:hypothetical protein